MGTPEFAVPSLERLVDAGYNIVAVITAPDKPSGRGMQMNESAVKKFALSKGLKILQPEKLKNPAFVNELKDLKADLAGCCCLSHVTRSGMEHATNGNYKSSWIFIASIPWSCTY